MKKFLVAFLATIMLSVPVFAQDTIITEENKVATKIGFAAFRWDDGAVGSYGTGLRLFGTDFWAFTYADFGEDGQSGNVEAAYLRNVKDVFNDIPLLNKVPVVSQLMNHTIFNKIIAGPILGPDFDITNVVDGEGSVSYARYAIGLMGVYQVFDNSGAWVYAKRKLTFDNSAAIGNNYVAGGGIYIGF